MIWYTSQSPPLFVSWSDHKRTSSDTRPPPFLSGQLTVVYTWLTNSDCLRLTPESSIMIKVFICTRASSSHWSVWKLLFVALGSTSASVSGLPLHPMLSYEYFMLCSSILGIIQLHYYFLCRLLTGYSKLEDFLEQSPSVPQWRFLEWTATVSWMKNGKDSRSVHCI
jgi:hypothetical protein